MKKTLLFLTFFLLTLSGFSQADLKVVNNDYKTYYEPGKTNTYTITIVNLGPLPATNVNVFNGIPSGVTSLNWTGPNGASGINTPLSDIIPTLPVGEVLTYVLNVVVPANFVGNLKSETVVKSTTVDPNPDCAQCVDIDTKATGADVVITNTDNKLYYTPGTSSIYTVKVTNKGPLGAKNVKVSNPIPAGITQFSWTGSNGSAGTDVALENTILLLKNDETVTYTITLHVPADFTGSLTSQASATSETTDPKPACDACTDTDALLAGADIAVTNTDNKITYTAGATNTYTVKVENKGPDAASGVLVTNSLPAGINPANVTWQLGSGPVNSGFLNDNIGVLAVGQIVTYTVKVNVPSSFAGKLEHNVSATSSAVSDPFPASNQAADIDTQANATDIVVVNTDNTDIYTPGTSTTYTVTVTNNGQIAATNVAVKDLVPAGIPAANVTWTGSNGSSGTGDLNDTIATLAVKQTVTYTVIVAIPAGFSGDLTSNVSFTSTTADSDPLCSRCTDVDRVRAGVVLVNSDGSPDYTAGQTRTYTVKVTNYDAAAATNVVVQDLVPAGIDPANVTWMGNGASGTGNLNNTIAVLLPNQSVTYTIVVKIPSNFDQKRELVNEATFSVNGVPNSKVCAECKDIDTPRPYADLQIVKTDNQDAFYYNSTNTYTIVISNIGPSDAKNVVVEDKVPAGDLPMTWTGSNGTSGSGTLNDIIPSLAPGEVVTYVVAVKIPQSYSPPDPTDNTKVLVNLTNTVTVTSETEDPTATCKYCTDTDAPRPDYVTVTTNNKGAANYTENLVKNILINSPCVSIDNFTSSPACGFGYFNRNNSDFPIKEGLIMRCGEVERTQGKFAKNYIGTTCSSKQDQDLQKINCNGGLGNCGSIMDASYVKFNFVAGGDKFSFRYLFASNEYGQYQCGFGDAFAFILTDLDDPNAIPHNLAVVPNSKNSVWPDGIPVSVMNVRKKDYHSGCEDNNPTYFGQYNSEATFGAKAGDPSKSEINMIGQTVVMTAASDVIPGHHYSLKLVIGDYSDSAFDSAVFIEAGSFDFGFRPIETPDGIKDNLPLCEGTAQVLRSGTAKLPGITYSWKHDGVVIPGADDYFIKVTKPGVYTVVYTYVISGCEQSDDFTVFFTEVRPLQEPIDLYVCDGAGNTFDLSKNVPVVLGVYDPQEYKIKYFATQADAEKKKNAITNYTAYNGKNGVPVKDGDSIYMTLEDLNATSTCIPIKTFKLHLTPPPTGTMIQYPEDDALAGFCRDSNKAMAVSKSTPFAEGGSYSISPTTGLTVDPATGDLDLTASIPGDYIVNYKVPANQGCAEYNTTASVKINACVTTIMDPIQPICLGDAVVLTCSDAGSGVVYTWSDAGGVLGTTTVPTFALPSSPAAAGNYSYSVEVSYGAEKSASSSQTLIVHPMPTASVAGSTSVCLGESAAITFSGTPEAFVTYNDGSADSTIQLSSTDGSYVLNTPSLSSTTTYQIVNVASNTTPSCIATMNSAATITVIDAPVATVSFGSASSICMGQATDVVFKNETPGAQVEVAYTRNGIPQSITLNPGQQKIVATGVLNEDVVYEIVSVTSAAAACVGYPVSSITVDVVVIPEPALNQKGYICIDPSTGETTRTLKLDTALDPSQYTFAWHYKEDGQAEIPLDETEHYYECDKVGQYRVVSTDNGPLHCQRTSIAMVLPSVPPVGVVAEVVTGYFENNATVVATAAPLAGTYEYRLDNGPYQDSNVFENVSYGTHVVHARDKEACAEVTSTVTVVDFPRYFTPNGDGYNDEWNISVLSDQPNAKIYIFDRFGKLLKQISPLGAGWDGTYNGHPMPADDYWFVVKYHEQLIDKEFKAHFSLKR